MHVPESVFDVMLVLVAEERVPGLLGREVNDGPAVPRAVVRVLVTTRVHHVNAPPVTDALLKPGKKGI